ncbi:DUF397 domain-containing protein [Streptomyces sp. BV286]|uniref:DUF397 domain-containing protein n=1 Tax=unclassified Streptomyces TaxID=2593676 RepID=UPI001C2E9E47|nr:DUF397 domain-containing protein [Streptomyces sp. BV286]MBV1936717.1 DUF397 domain-containing protein [Streptomyces sp. BV286]
MSPAPDLTTATWRKSSCSGGSGDDCVNAAADIAGAALSWRKSSYSSGSSDDCVEVRDDLPGIVPVRDSKAPSRGVLVFGAAAWSSFVAATAGHDR